MAGSRGSPPFLTQQMDLHDLHQRRFKRCWGLTLSCLSNTHLSSLPSFAKQSWSLKGVLCRPAGMLRIYQRRNPEWYVLLANLTRVSEPPLQRLFPGPLAKASLWSRKKGASEWINCQLFPFFTHVVVASFISNLLEANFSERIFGEFAT